MIIFMRHGQAEHNLNEPKNFNLKNPKLTDKGKKDTKNMRKYLSDNSQFWVSPTIRTIETAFLLIHNKNQVNAVDILSPRIYPHKNRRMNSCDQMVFTSNAKAIHFINLLANKQHPNDLNDAEFLRLFQYFVNNYINDYQDHIIVTHDGVIATLLKYYRKISLARNENNNLMLNNDIYQFGKNELASNLL